MGLIEVLRLYYCGLISEIIRRKGIQSSTRVKSTLESPTRSCPGQIHYSASLSIRKAMKFSFPSGRKKRKAQEQTLNHDTIRTWVNKILNKGPIAIVNSMRVIALSFYTTNKKKRLWPKNKKFPCLIKSIHIWLICSLVLVKSWQCCINVFPHFNVDKSWSQFNKIKGIN